MSAVAHYASFLDSLPFLDPVPKIVPVNDLLLNRRRREDEPATEAGSAGALGLAEGLKRDQMEPEGLWEDGAAGT